MDLTKIRHARDEICDGEDPEEILVKRQSSDRPEALYEISCKWPSEERTLARDMYKPDAIGIAYALSFALDCDKVTHP